VLCGGRDHRCLCVIIVIAAAAAAAAAVCGACRRRDPFLGAALAPHAVRGIQSKGVIANAKHWVDNSQETNRTTNIANVDERTQMEVYYPPFEAALDAVRSMHRPGPINTACRACVLPFTSHAAGTQYTCMAVAMHVAEGRRTGGAARRGVACRVWGASCAPTTR
jgi:hypothetical protein